MELTPTDPQSRPGPSEWFSGAVEMTPLATAQAPGRVRVVRVAFAAGARTAWHTHPFGQVLHVLEGTARVCSDGGEAREVPAGGTVGFAPGERHWHGAGPAGPMVHLAIQEADEEGETTYWQEHVDD